MTEAKTSIHSRPLTQHRGRVGALHSPIVMRGHDPCPYCQDGIEDDRLCPHCRGKGHIPNDDREDVL